MCVIVSKPPTATLDKDRAKRLWDRNSHGGGFAFIDGSNRIQVTKSMEFDEYWHKYSSALGRNRDADFLLHMRIATQGSISIPNVHPFWVGEEEDMVLAHNGVIDAYDLSQLQDGGLHATVDDQTSFDWDTEDDYWFESQYNAYYEDLNKGKKTNPTDDRSDTRIFVDEYLPNLPSDWLDNPYLVHMIEEFIGWSKLMILTNRPELRHNVYILNANRGESKDGMWFSNNHGVEETKSYKSSAKSAPGKKWKGPDKVRVKPFDKDNPTEQGWIDVASPEYEAFIKERRVRNGLNTDISFNKDENRWFCWDCFGDIETLLATAGDCDCWDLVCVTCNELPPDCECDDDDKVLTSWSTYESQNAIACAVVPMKKGE